jgi:carotenoid 1,2-hydratase
MRSDRASPPAGPEPRFDLTVPLNGYRWWYVDGLSDDGRLGVVVIAFVGSVFSPRYFAARAAGDADPEDFCAINVGLYRARGKRWAFTERHAGHLERTSSLYRLGPSRLEWRDGTLAIEVEERSAPLRRPLVGRILLRPAFLNAREFLLDRGGRHAWRPIAPRGRIEVDFAQPEFAWRGSGYLDTNAGERALEDDFARWHWSRGHRDGETSISYAVTERSGDEGTLALAFSRDGSLTEVEPPGEIRLPATGWRIDRPALARRPLELVRTLEDTPFYARSLLADTRDGVVTPVMHESLSLERFAAPWVRLLLPFRMGRAGA